MADTALQLTDGTGLTPPEPHDLPLPAVKPAQQTVGAAAGANAGAAIGGGGLAPAGGGGTGGLTLLQQAQRLAGIDISGQVSPLTADIGALQRSQQGASGAISQEFASILPSVADSAQRLEQMNANAGQAAQQIYQAAGQQLNTMQQNSAAQAQQLAQQTGGPVSIGQFTAAGDPYSQAIAASGAVDQMTTQELGLSSDRTAEVFAGQVFPALALEQQQKNRDFYENQIKGLRDQITQIKATKGTLVSSNLAKLQRQQLQHRLDLANLALKRQSNNRNWIAEQRRLDQTDRRLRLEEGTLRQAGYYKGVSANQEQQRIETQKAHYTAEEKATAQRLGISAQNLALRAQHYQESDQLAHQRLQVQQQRNAMSLIDAAMGKDSSKPVTLTRKVNLQANDPLVIAALTNPQHPPADVHRDAQGNWYVYKKETLTPGQWMASSGVPNAGGMHDPNQLYQLLIANNTPKAMARSLVRAKTGLNDWTPGRNVGYNAADLARMSLRKLERLAEARGFSGQEPQTKQAAIDFIISTNPGT